MNGIPLKSMVPSVLTGLYYMISSIALTSSNKVLYSVYGWTDTLLLVWLQSSFTVSIFLLLSFVGLTDARAVFCSGKMRRGVFWRSFVPLFLAYISMVASSLASLNVTSLAVYNSLRRCTIVFVMVAQFLRTGDLYSQAVKGSVALMVIGSLVAGATDVTFNIRGYSLILLANISTSVYLTSMAPAKEALGSSNFFIQALDSLTVFFILGNFVSPVPVFHHLKSGVMDVGYATSLVMSIVMGVVLNHSVYLNTSINSPLTQQVFANFKDVILWIASVTVFDKGDVSKSSGLGTVLGLFGSCSYAFYCVKDAEVKP
jgi:solute carrier family 35